MKIAFFGLVSAFDYFQIGGTESFIRRISFELIKDGINIDYILYNSKENKNLIFSEIKLHYFSTLDNALKAVQNGKYNHVITVYLLPKDRLKYALFRKSNSMTSIFHYIYFSWPDSVIKRKLYFEEARIFPYNGKLFCISKRQYDYISKWTKSSVHLFPPVPENFFLKPEEKPVNKKIKITFLGRIDPGKGIKEVIEIFNVLKNNNKFECSIYGIYIPEDKESLKIHKWLKTQDLIKYFEVDRQKYSPIIEDFARNIFKETDIFIQPYQRLSSTIDTPLLLLETMASLCAVITKPFGNIPDIYGESKFLIPEKNFISDTIKLLENISYEDIIAERKRIYCNNLELNFGTENVCNIFWENLEKKL